MIFSQNSCKPIIEDSGLGLILTRCVESLLQTRHRILYFYTAYFNRDLIWRENRS